MCGWLKDRKWLTGNGLSFKLEEKQFTANHAEYAKWKKEKGLDIVEPLHGEKFAQLFQSKAPFFKA
jgi:hypothetical protein